MFDNSLATTNPSCQVLFSPSKAVSVARMVPTKMTAATARSFAGRVI